MMRSHPLRCTAFALVTLAVSAMTPAAAAPAPAAAAPAPAATSLAGTWRVSRTCVSGCTGSTTVTEVVHSYAPHVFIARGGRPLVLYQVGNQVLVHGATSSSLLAIRIPGQLMSGSSVGTNGSTFTTSWRCVAAPTSTASPAGSRTAGITQEGPRVAPRARVHC